MLKPEEKIIDGHKVVVMQLPGRQANHLKIRLFKLIGSSLGSLVKSLKIEKTDAAAIRGGKKSLLDTEIDLALISAAIDAVAEKITPEEFDGLVFETLTTTSIDGELVNSPIVFDRVFTGGNMLFMYKVLLFTLEVNFRDFLAVSGISRQ